MPQICPLTGRAGAIEGFSMRRYLDDVCRAEEDRDRAEQAVLRKMGMHLQKMGYSAPEWKESSEGED